MLLIFISFMPTGFEKAIFPEYRRFLTYLRIHLPPSLSILFSVIHCRNLLLCSHIPPFHPVPDSHCFHLPPFCPVPDSHCFHLPPFPFPPGGKSSFQWILLLNLLYQIMKFVFLPNISRILLLLHLGEGWEGGITGRELQVIK